MCVSGGGVGGGGGAGVAYFDGKHYVFVGVVGVGCI